MLPAFITDFFYHHIAKHIYIFQRFVLYFEQNIYCLNYLNRYYQLDTFIPPNKKVLDVGGNRGNLSFIINDYESYTLIEPLKLHSNKNIISIQKKFEHFDTKKKYDIILLFAVHDYINLTPTALYKKIQDLLDLNGIVCIKSHRLPDTKFDEITNVFSKHFIPIYQKEYTFCFSKRKLFYYKKNT